ncbi:MAG: lamin tail domain-containing protein, partial [Nanoarchaeota archaeon]
MRGKNSWCLGVILIFFVEFVNADIRINEIMADPYPCDDKYCEWIELYNDNESSVNISGWKFSDDDSEDYFDKSYFGNEDIIIPGLYYAIIVDSDTRIQHNFDIDDNVIWIYVDDVMGGSGLNNNGETITIYDSKENVIDSTNYEKVNSSKTWALVNEVWKESEPTPGRSNENNESYSNDYSVIEISEFLPNPEGDDDKAMPDGEWVELYNNGKEKLDLFGFKIRDNSNKEVLIDNVHTDDTIIKSKKYLVVYMNGAYGFLNNDGLEKIRLYDLDDNLIDEVSYSESKEGVSWSKVEDRWRMSVPSIAGENSDEKINNSVLKIEQFYDFGSNKVAEWGDVLRVKVNIY